MLHQPVNFLRALLLGTTVCGAAIAAEEWTDLFNGKDLNGWVQRGGKATYAVADGGIVGTSTPNTPNSFLCTSRDYADFIMEYEFKVDPRLNSGVQIRSQCFDTPTTFDWKGKTIKVAAGVVHGYQIEIDPDPVKNRWWSGGLYDESARGWLYPGALGGDGKAFTDQGRRIFNPGDWNKVRVEASGDSIRITLNGTVCVDIKDSRVLSGFIGLQVHAISGDETKAGSQVRWRNLRIQELAAQAPNTLSEREKTAGWRLLWDGKTSTGWRGAGMTEFPKSGWEINDGTLFTHASDGKEAAGVGDIISREKFSDFELMVDFKITPGANSGIKIFVDPDLNHGQGSAIGPEFQILDDKLHPDAKLGTKGNRTMGSLYDMIPAPEDKKVNPVGEWNHAHIISKGKHVEFRLNGAKTAEFDRGSKAWRDLVAVSKFKVWPNFGELSEGHILLQEHGNQVFFRNIKILAAAAK